MKHELLGLLLLLVVSIGPSTSASTELFVLFTMIRRVLLAELLRVENARFIVRGRIDMPRFEILRVDLGRLLAVIGNLFVVTIFKHHIVLVGLHELELPEAELVMANA